MALIPDFSGKIKAVSEISGDGYYKIQLELEKASAFNYQPVWKGTGKETKIDLGDVVAKVAIPLPELEKRAGKIKPGDYLSGYATQQGSFWELEYFSIIPSQEDSR